MIELAIAMMFGSHNTFADDANVCAAKATYAESRECIETIWKDRNDASMRHCANDEDSETNCIWEGSSRTNNGRYVDVDGIAYYVRLDHITLTV